MEQVKEIGAGLVDSSALTPASIHDDEFDIDVYPATNTDNAKLDLFVPAYGKVQITIDCVNAIYRFTQTPFHLIMAVASHPDDYGMTEYWVRQLQKSRPNITLCHNHQDWKSGNTFFNVGLKYARTPYFATIMNSTTVEPAWETTALSLMESDPQIGTIGFKCLFPNGHIESAGIAFVGHLPVDMGRDEPGYRCNEIREVPAVQWAFALHRTKALMGNLDDTIFNPHVGWDDIDNCLVLKSKGWKIMYCGQGVGIHRPRETRGSNSNEASRLNQENAKRFFKRWGLWEKYLEGNSKMDVSNVLKFETKAKLAETISKIQVLRSYLQQAETEMQGKVNEAMKELGVNDGKYLLEMNPQNNTWLLKINPKEAVQETVTDPSGLKPASDTDQKAELKNTVELVKAVT